METDDAKRRLMDPLTAKAAVYALATLETNAKMGIIVATPTAGSSALPSAPPPPMRPPMERSGASMGTVAAASMTASTRFK